MRFVLGMLCLTALTGCATTTATSVTNNAVCSVWREISWSKKDTDKTITEIKVNNARRGVWCIDVKE